MLRALLPIPAFLLLLPLFLPAPGGAQTILNVERFQLSAREGMHVELDLSGSGQAGNTRLLDARIQGILGVVTEHHWPRIILGGRYLRQGGQEPALDNQFVQLRYSYLFSPKTRSFHFVQVQRNETLRLRERLLVGSGLQRDFQPTEATSLSLGGGLMGEWEELDPEAVGPEDGVSARAVRMTVVGVLRHTLKAGPELVNISYVQPDITEFGDVRLLNDAALRVPLGSALTVVLASEWRYDSRPPSVLRSYDLSYRMGVTIALR